MPGCTSSAVGLALSMASSRAWGIVAFDLAEAGRVSRGACVVAIDAQSSQGGVEVREKRL